MLVARRRHLELTRRPALSIHPSNSNAACVHYWPPPASPPLTGATSFRPAAGTTSEPPQALFSSQKNFYSTHHIEFSDTCIKH